MPQEHSQVGALVRSWRQRAGMTQDALAAKIRCSKAQLSLMETGQRTVSSHWARRIEKALKIKNGALMAALQWHAVPPQLRPQVNHSQSQSRLLAGKLKQALASDDPVAALRSLLERSGANVDAPVPLMGKQAETGGGIEFAGRGIPVINKVAAGYPAEFTDLDYPASVADEYVSCPDVSDPDAFAARVVGNSMEPEYREGDLVVFSPLLPTPAGSDCFVRLERDAQTTFKRVYFEDEGNAIRLQPLNSAFAPQIVPRQDVAGMYAAAYVMRRVSST